MTTHSLAPLALASRRASEAIRSIACCSLTIVALTALDGIAHGQTPVGTVPNLPQPDGNAYSTSFRYDSSGNLYAWDGLSAWEQSGGAGAFTNIGSVDSGNAADAGPITFSQDGQTLLLSNGAGGALGGSYNGVFWTMPASGGAATQVTGSGIPYTYDALALPAAATIPGAGSKYVVYEGNSSYAASALSVLDSSAGTSQVIIANGPGATTSIAFNPQDNSLYVGVGYGPDAGNIYSFSLSQIDSAYSSRMPLNFLSAGKLFDPAGTGSQTGGGMFFDKNGYLFSGGDGITVFSPNGTICYDQPAGSADGYFDELVYDPVNNEVLKIPFGASAGILYNAAAFEPAAAIWSSTAGTGGSWASAANWSPAAVPVSGTVTFAGTPARPLTVTLDGNQAATGLVFDVADTAGYTLSQGTGGELTLGTSSAGASIAVLSGSQTISALVVLPGNLAVSVSAGAVLDLSGSIGQATETSASLSLSGEGELILSGTSDYSGGTTIEGGTLCVTSSRALPDGSSLVIGADGVFIFEPSPAAAPAHSAVAAVPEPSTLVLLATLVLSAWAVFWSAATCRRFLTAAPLKTCKKRRQVAALPKAPLFQQYCD